MSSEGIPRGPPEWGELLFQEPWSWHRRFQGRDDILMGVMTIGVGLGLVALGWYTRVVDGSPLGLTIFLWAIAVPVILIGRSLVHMEVTRMPFCVYERGLTSNQVSFSDGLHRRQTFIPAHRFTGIKVHDSVVRGKRGEMAFRSLALSYFDDEEVERDLVLVLSDLANWYRAFLAMGKVLERLIDDDLRESMRVLRSQHDWFEDTYGIPLSGDGIDHRGRRTSNFPPAGETTAVAIASADPWELNTRVLDYVPRLRIAAVAALAASALIAGVMVFRNDAFSQLALLHLGGWAVLFGLSGVLFLPWLIKAVERNSRRYVKRYPVNDQVVRDRLEAGLSERGVSHTQGGEFFWVDHGGTEVEVQTRFAGATTYVYVEPPEEGWSMHGFLRLMDEVLG